MHAHADKAMAEVFDAVYASLHVRVSNKGAFHLYTQTLGYECVPHLNDPSCSCHSALHSLSTKH